MLLSSSYKEGVEKYFWTGDEERALFYQHRVCGYRRIWQECANQQKLLRTGCWVLMPTRLFPQRSTGIGCYYPVKGRGKGYSLSDYKWLRVTGVLLKLDFALRKVSALNECCFHVTARLACLVYTDRCTFQEVLSIAVGPRSGEEDLTVQQIDCLLDKVRQTLRCRKVQTVSPHFHPCIH